MKRKVGISLLLVAVLALGVAAAAWAGPGFGPGWERGNKGRYAGVCGPNAAINQLTPEKRQALIEAQTKFFNDTLALRQKVQQKRLELRALWANPETTKAALSAKQAEVSELTAQLAQKRLDHRYDLNKQFPELSTGAGFGPGFCGGPGFGPGPGYGPRYGRGGYGMGRVW